MSAISVTLRERGLSTNSAVLHISQLPKSDHLPVVAGPRQTPTLFEGAEYRYDVQLPQDLKIDRLEPSTFFDPDTDSWRGGRLRTGESVGVWSIEIRCDNSRIFEGQLNVRTSKLDEDAFATMLSQLAELSTEVLHQGFAPSSGQYSPNHHEAPRLAYQQFAVLNALLRGGELKLAIDRFQSRPYSTWKTEVAPQSASRPIPKSSRLRWQLTKPGPRLPVNGLTLESLPKSLYSEHAVETLDNLPNRYVKFLLERWRELAASILSMTEKLGPSVRRRGQTEAQAVMDYLDEVLNSPTARAIGQLGNNPGDNSVLRHRDGYRQIAGAAAIIESSLGLDVDIEDPFLVSRRSVATLYEVWAFVRLAQALASVFNQPVLPELFRPSENGMTLLLRPGQDRVLSFETVLYQQELAADLFFNRSFANYLGGPKSGTSWTRPMRPDASVVVRRKNGSEVWLHFDAKYRMSWTELDDPGCEAISSERVSRAHAKGEDLNKMHAYRDAIWDSAGSYVLFPGDAHSAFTKLKQEPLPGIGAIPLRPTATEADIDYLEDFFRQAVRHVSAGASRDRRANYWSNRAYREMGASSPVPLPPRGELPPADTSVLVGYVRSTEQWDWIKIRGLYNVRSGDRRGALSHASPALDAALLLLWSEAKGSQKLELFHRAGIWNAVTAEDMIEMGYKDPRGKAYLVTEVNQSIDSPEWINSVRIKDLTPAGSIPGAPFTTTWLNLALAAE